MTSLTCADLFAGMGGTALGATQAGFTVKISANHWPVAVVTHRLNHPDTTHVTQDLQQADFHSWPDFDVLLASPACQGHSVARGKDRPHHDNTRSTAWAVVACAEAKRPFFLVVENVPDYLNWVLYPQWKSCLETLGYALHEQVLDAADLGVPQHRRRLFVTGVHKSAGTEPLAVAQGKVPHVPASTILDGDADNWSPVRKKGRATATVTRIENGRARFGERFLAPFFGSGSGKTGRSLARPLGTVTTRDRYCLVDGDRMRMLTARENVRAQGFPDSYRVPSVHKLAVHLAGNAVPPAMMKWACEHIKAYQGR